GTLLNRARDIFCHRGQGGGENSADYSPPGVEWLEWAWGNGPGSEHSQTDRHGHRQQFGAVPVTLVGTLVALIEDCAEQEIKTAVGVGFFRRKRLASGKLPRDRSENLIVDASRRCHPGCGIGIQV